MKEGTQLTQPRRKELVDIIGEAYGSGLWNRAKSKYDSVRSDLHDAYIQETAEKSESMKQLVVGLQRVREQHRRAELAFENSKVDVESAKEKLKLAGFELERDGSLSMSHNAPDSLRESIDKRLDKALGTKEQVITLPFERARLKLLTVATAEEAEKIVEPLLNFEVKAS